MCQCLHVSVRIFQITFAVPFFPVLVKFAVSFFAVPFFCGVIFCGAIFLRCHFLRCHFLRCHFLRLPGRPGLHIKATAKIKVNYQQAEIHVYRDHYKQVLIPGLDAAILTLRCLLISHRKKMTILYWNSIIVQCNKRRCVSKIVQCNKCNKRSKCSAAHRPFIFRFVFMIDWWRSTVNFTAIIELPVSSMMGICVF